MSSGRLHRTVKPPRSFRPTARCGEVEPQPCHKVGLSPSPRNPGLPGFRIIVRKSGKPDLRWGGVRGGGPGGWQRLRLIPTHPPPPPPPAGLPASGNFKRGQTPASRGLVGGGSTPSVLRH